MNAVWSQARASVRVRRGSLAGSALVVALAAALLTATGVWLDAGVRSAGDLTGSMLLAFASSFTGTALVVALLVVSTTFSATLRPRARELALLRAVGATTAQVRRLVTAEVLLVFAVAAPVGVVPGLLLAPRLSGTLSAAGIVPPGFTPGLSAWPVLGTLALLVPTALATARLASRESALLDPAVAVRASATDPGRLPRGRVVAAGVLAVVGVLAAGSPLFVPGTVGAASASLTAFLLVIAAALAGPLLLAAVARRGLAAVPRSRATATLALLNARGFSRRTTGAIVPLALLLAVGTVQSGVATAVADAAERQLRDSIHADLVVTGPGSPDDVARALTAVPDVTGFAALRSVPARVRTDREDADVPVIGELDWDPSSVLVLPDDAVAGGGPSGVGARSGVGVDPGVVAGSLATLAGGHTIAVSEDAALGSAGLGHTVDVRVGDTVTSFTVGAIYSRGLGVGDYVLGAAGAAHLGTADSTGTLLVRADDDTAAVRAAVTRAVAGVGAGWVVTDVNGYARAARDSAAGQQDLSTALLLALLALVAVMAANTLVLTTRSRRAELTLLRRTGATRRQVLTMVLTESALIVTTAVLVGLACALPALAGVGQGLAGVPVPVIDPPVLGGLLAVVAAIGLGVPVAVAAAGSRNRTAA